jgi:hypothetical protein
MGTKKKGKTTTFSPLLFAVVGSGMDKIRIRKNGLI